MKKIIVYIIFSILSFNIFYSFANAVECHPAYKGNWWVTNNCDWPDWYKVYWDIYVWDYTITMWANDDMWIDLNSKKITFNNWKINLASTAKIANHVTTRYYISVSYNTNWTWGDCDSDNSWNQCTACPSWMIAFNIEWRAPKQDWSDNYLNKTTKDNPGPYDSDNDNVRVVSDSWTFYCWTEWVSNQ